MQYDTRLSETPRPWPSHEHQVYAARRSARARSARALTKRVDNAPALTSAELSALLMSLAVNIESNGHR